MFHIVGFIKNNYVTPTNGLPFATSFPGSLILPPPGASKERDPLSSLAVGGGKMRDPGNELYLLMRFVSFTLKRPRTPMKTEAFEYGFGSEAF